MARIPFPKGNQLGKANKGRKGQVAWNKGKKLSAEHREHLKGKRPNACGENHRLWIKDRTKALEASLRRKSLEWKVWRGEVFERDKYTCQECGASGVYLEPHHIITVKSDNNKVYDIKNGITLCRPCHIKTMGKESNFIEKYFMLVAV